MKATGLHASQVGDFERADDDHRSSTWAHSGRHMNGVYSLVSQLSSQNGIERDAECQGTCSLGTAVGRPVGRDPACDEAPASLVIDQGQKTTLDGSGRSARSCPSLWAVGLFWWMKYTLSGVFQKPKPR